MSRCTVLGPWSILYTAFPWPCLQKLEQLNQFPDFNNYLIFVLTRLKSEGKLWSDVIWFLLLFSVSFFTTFFSFLFLSPSVPQAFSWLLLFVPLMCSGFLVRSSLWFTSAFFTPHRWADTFAQRSDSEEQRKGSLPELPSSSGRIHQAGMSGQHWGPISSHSCYDWYVFCARKWSSVFCHCSVYWSPHLKLSLCY